MNESALLDALGLPGDARVDQRVPKKLLIEHGAPTASDRRQISEGIEQLRWVAVLKPTTIGVPVYQDAEREYLEIAVLSLTLRANARAGRLTELVHRAVPYPVWLVTTQAPKLILSLAHKRWSQGEAGKTVLDGKVIEVVLDVEDDGGDVLSFRNALALTHQPRSTLRALYQGWIDCVTALLVARITGSFVLPESTERATAQREALDTYAWLQHEVALLRTQAAKEKQISRRVELNLELNRLEAELVLVSCTLEGEPSDNLNYPRAH